MCIHQDQRRRFHTPSNRRSIQLINPKELRVKRAKVLKKVVKTMDAIDKLLEADFREIMPVLNPLERKRLVALIQEVDSFKFECKGRMVSIKEKIEAEEDNE